MRGERKMREQWMMAKLQAVSGAATVPISRLHKEMTKTEDIKRTWTLGKIRVNGRKQFLGDRCNAVRPLCARIWAGGGSTRS